MPASLRAPTISGQISWWRSTYSSSYPGLTSKTHAYCAICPPNSFRLRRTRDRAGVRPCAACPRGGLRRYVAVVRRAFGARRVGGGVAEERFPVSVEPDHKDPDQRPRSSPAVVCPHPPLPSSVRIYLGYASFTPPSTLRTLPVLLDERASEAKWSTASATFSGSTFTFRTLRSR